jgi:hypothetical protein
MKRSVAIENIINVLRLTGNHYCDNGRDEQDAERILNRMETLGMFYCPVEDYGEFQLRTPKGWGEE